MAIIETSHPAPFGAVSTLRVVNAFDAVRATIVNAYNAVQTEKALSKLSNSQLDDIGLMRADIRKVAARAARR